ncbi:A component of insecticidal toxin complex (Tc) [Xenorhabdus bovienii str. kraussei Quebec]|uniref:A component of insecticidal toxin complex (Tc) n=1 Tax=Xenorhabdus bovienii str. kraussei Quebec TaxID=1398203 RepID=A0A077PMI1_XENBV|nr:neuraminidase-like domain-containing protein [Xenorhabdus bovienii]CDH21941.1 A component of insecticidal toxin complex (Tc) [Xenorhabdus bovienii str. kraussei Quebec]
MYSTAVLLNKISPTLDGRTMTLADLQHLSFSELRKTFDDQLSWGESHYLYREAVEQKKRHRLLEARIFTRANPQLSGAIRRGIEQDDASRSYDEMFGSRSSSFVNPGSVASMFSPAGYLTELYREAKDLHFTSSAYHLDNRRPDLADIALSQNNMDSEISTLALSNELLLAHITRKTGDDSDALMESLSTYRKAVDTPYHQPYETVRQVIMAHDRTLSALSRNPEVMAQTEGASLLAIQANISPELYHILTEEITEENADALFAKNFSENITPENFASQAWIAKHYGLELSKVQKYLGMLQNGYSDNTSVYVDNISTGLVTDHEGKLEVYKITRIPGKDYTQHLNFWDLLYYGDNKFVIRASYKKSGGTVKVRKDVAGKPGESKVIGTLPSPTTANTVCQCDLSYLTVDELKNGVPIFSSNRDGIAGVTGKAVFSFENYPLNIFALKLNKAIRLCLATGLLPNALQTIVRSDNAQGIINNSVLTKVFYTLFYSTRYALSADDAQVLNGSVINQYADDDSVSHFNRLFNTPPLKGKIFEADGNTVSIDPNEEPATFACSALIRGLGINSGDLYQLGRLAGVLDTKNNITLSVSVISSLYRLKLLAQTHQLTVNELCMLYGFSPFSGKATASLSSGELAQLVIWLYQVTQWLTEAAITTEKLWLLCTPEFSGNISPEINNLINTLRPRISEDIAQSGDRKLQAEILAPFIAATLHLASPDMARYILLWTDNLRPGGLNIAGFMTLVLKETLSDDETTQLVQFCHVMAQLSLSVQTLRLSEAELSVLVISGFTVLGERSQPAGQHNIDTLFSLYRFHQWINALGNSSSDTLDMLRQQTLMADRLASVMSLDISMVTQAMACAGVSSLQSWQNINAVLQWMDVASELHTMPSVIRTLVNIRYVTVLNKAESGLPSWDEWQTLAENMEAGLSTQQAQALADHTAERLSSVLCHWFLANIPPEGMFLQSRDDLYSYFLIDNQVSSAVKTTRLAEAIAGIQLYINRALNRIEPNARANVSTRQFFTDWAVNNRYSTWGGVSRLVYYPENYLDPTQRIGQTRMMDELLENISQSKFSRDTVEEAFKTYLTRFETVADLKVVSAYHDNVNSDTGLTWFVGQTRENLPDYYWRNVDISRLQAGKLAANAWKEWTKIDTAVNPYKDAIRPVIFRERQHLIWVEKEEVAKNGTDPVKTYDRFTLKLVFLRHDGSWSAPWSYDITSQVMAVTDNNPDAKRLGLAASGFQGEDTLLVFVYKTEESYKDFGGSNTHVAGMTIYGDGSLKKMENTALNRYSQLKNTFDIINTQDNGLVRKANYRFAQDFEVPTSLNMGSATGTYNLTVMENGNIPQITSQYAGGSLNITLYNATFTVRYHGGSDVIRNKQIRAMKLTGLDGKSQVGDAFIIADSAYYAGRDGDNGGPITVYNKTKNYIASVQDSQLPYILRRLDLYSDKNILPLFLFFFSPLSPLNAVFAVDRDRASDFRKCRRAQEVGSDLSTQVDKEYTSYYSYGGWLEIDTGANSAGTQITVEAGSKTHAFTAGANVISPPANSFDGMQYTFKPLVIDASGLVYHNNAAPVDISFEVKAKDGRVLGKIRQTLTVRKRDYNPANIFCLQETRTGVQYMQLGVYRIRLNTLLAPQLVSRANTGIDTILTMETQQLPEPQLGKGFYTTFTLPPYDPATHGTSRSFKLNLKHVVNDNAHVIYSGLLQDTELAVRLFIPLDDTPRSQGYIARVFLTTQKNPNDVSWAGPHFTDDGGKIGIHAKSDTSMFADEPIIHNGTTTEPLDFNGACALYYWELFYYTPMMCFQRLLQEKQYDEATKWMNYVYNPAGYIVNGEIAPWIWNCRPLEETISWHTNPLDAVDPDAVAQHDPTHYKVATFMRLLDQLITRGDMAYRELTRDALNEAKMWYVRALELLGDEPKDYGSSQWAAPSLSVAASQTVQAAYQQDLAALDSGDVSTQPRTANSLAGLFLPEYNPALTDYWKTLRLRLFNLRNNLSIDGQPLSLAIYGEPTDPQALLTSMVQSSQGGSALPTGTLSLYRFPVMLERARNLGAQLTQFGTSLLSMAEHDDADELTTLLLQQGMELSTQSIRIQQRTVDEVDADITVLAESRRSAQNRLEKYQQLYDEDINHGEQRAMSLFDAAASQSLAGQALSTAGGVADALPNVFGLANGGSQWGAPMHAASVVLSLSATASQSSAEKISRSETYRRRRQEWEIQRDNADGEVRQMDAQLDALNIRREAAQMQVEYQETQQAQTQAQLELLQRKFTNKALYSWMRGKLSAIYYQFFDLTQSFCLMAQEALRRELNDKGVTFIRGGVWNGTTAGLMAGETLLLNLAEMEKAWLERDERALEVTRTVSLAQVYQTLPSDSFSLTEKLTQFLRDGKGNAGVSGNELKLSSGQIAASVRLSDLNIFGDYPDSLGRTRQLKQVSVTLPALVGPYEDIRAVLNYGGSVMMPRGCSAIALSHGMNDSGQFVLDFNDARYLPFEGIPVNDSGSLTLSFPDATDRQKAILQSLNDIILHIRYTIRS